MNNRLSNKISTFGGTGTFWLKNMEEEEQVPFMRMLTRLTLGSSFQSQFEESVEWMTGAKQVLVENLLWQFKEAQVVAINAELNQRLKAKAVDTDGTIYIAIARPSVPDYTKWTPLFLSQNPDNLYAILTELDDFILWPINYEIEDNWVISLEEKKIWYLLPIPHGYTPLAIATEKRDLVLGLNFYARDGFLIFFEPPLEIFAQRNFVVRSAWKTLNHPFDYVWGVDGI